MILLTEETMDVLDSLQTRYENEAQTFFDEALGCQSCSNTCSGCEGSCGGACENGPNLKWD